MPQICANKHLFGITDEIFFSLTDRDGEMASELKKKNFRENETERERETDKKKTTEKSTTFKLHRNPTRSYIKPLDQLLRRKIKSSVNGPSISKTVVI